MCQVVKMSKFKSEYPICRCQCRCGGIYKTGWVVSRNNLIFAKGLQEMQNVYLGNAKSQRWIGRKFLAQDCTGVAETKRETWFNLLFDTPEPRRIASLPVA